MNRAGGTHFFQRFIFNRTKAWLFKSAGSAALRNFDVYVLQKPAAEKRTGSADASGVPFTLHTPSTTP